MNITLEYGQAGGRSRRVWLGKDQVLRFGRSNRADVVIDSDSKLADVHFEVIGLGHEWRITSVGTENTVFVNGKLTNYHPLEHGDLVQAGGTQFWVTIEGLTPPKAPVSEKPSEPVLLEPKALTFSSKAVPSKVVEFTVAAQDSELSVVVNALIATESFADCSVYCALNTKRLGRPLSSLPQGDSDLFSNAPEEIRESDSLAILPVPSPIDSSTLGELAFAGRRNASFLVFSPHPLSVYLESHKLVWGWYGRPSILHQQSTLGSSVLAEKLILDRELILLFGSTPNEGIKLLVQKAHGDRLTNALKTIFISSS